ncbi:hypothetical protein LXL04_020782 [Taraxacum kok-saghyz]
MVYQTFVSQIVTIAVGCSRPSLPPCLHLQRQTHIAVLLPVLELLLINSIFKDLCRIGLEGLVSLDERFGNYRNDLFSHKSRELDRELLGVADNNHINASIIFYLRSIVGRDGRMRLKWTIMMC